MTRKEAVAEYKARKPVRGAFAVRCTATAEAWVGASPNLNSAQNGIWFSLRLGKHPDRTLQSAWDANGEPAFQYEILQMLDDDLSPLAVKDLLKEKRSAWAAQLGAGILL